MTRKTDYTPEEWHNILHFIAGVVWKIEMRRCYDNDWELKKVLGVVSSISTFSFGSPLMAALGPDLKEYCKEIASSPKNAADFKAHNFIRKFVQPVKDCLKAKASPRERNDFRGTIYKLAYKLATSSGSGSAAQAFGAKVDFDEAEVLLEIKTELKDL
jgi:hypothetical protein